MDGEMQPEVEVGLNQDQVLPLLQALAGWGDLVTIIFSGGSIFEYKGPFPKGAVAEGYYNLNGPTPGLHGHLRLDRLLSVRFQDRAHRGRPSYAFVFEDNAGETAFKVFLGRDAEGEVLPQQLSEFQRIRSELRV
ncbi:MAG: heme utilization cystosolic carrier protein HutX [Pseudomonadota bacterium]